MIVVVLPAPLASAGATVPAASAAVIAAARAYGLFMSILSAGPSIPRL
jgi:hypothetical protein